MQRTYYFSTLSGVVAVGVVPPYRRALTIEDPFATEGLVISERIAADVNEVGGREFDIQAIAVSL